MTFLLRVLIVLPLLVHAGLFAAGVARSGWITFGRLDLVVAAVATGYLLLIVWAMRSARIARPMAAIMIGSVLALVAAELVAHAWIPSPVLTRYPLPPMRTVRPIAPTLAGIEGPAQFSVSRWGVRGPDIDPRSAQRRILCVGGSTTECLYVTDERSWPWRLATLLGEASEETVYVGNAGRSGHMAAHHLELLAHYPGVSSYQTVLVLCGINDLGALLHGDRRQRESRVGEEALFDRDRPHDAYYRRFALWRLMETVLDVGNPLADGQIIQDPAGTWIDRFRASRRQKLRENLLAQPPATLTTELDAFRRDLRALAGMAAERGLKLVWITQPSLWSETPDDESEKLLWEQVDDGAYATPTLYRMLEAYNEVMREVADETETRCIDLARQLPSSPDYFYDDCHFTDQGCAQVAKILAAALAEPSP